MEAHVAAGNRAEALRVYEQCRRLLAEELGAYPSPETESIYRELLEAPSAHEVGCGPTGPSTGDREPEPRRTVERSAPARAGRRRLAVVLVCGAIATAGAGAATARGAHARSVWPGDRQRLGRLGRRVRRPELAIDRAGAVKTGPSAIAVGEGAIWSANLDDDSVSEIDPGTNASIQTMPVGKGRDGVAVGGGFVWVANGLDGTVSKIDPRIGSGRRRRSRSGMGRRASPSGTGRCGSRTRPTAR